MTPLALPPKGTQTDLPDHTTDKAACLMAATLMAKYNVTRVVNCPGTRNVPLTIALARSGKYDISTVIDERSAAFQALGMSLVSSQPVAVCCTSGTAVLNMAPAIAEAYYRHLPLIVISADRPSAWIGQDDSQTIRQPGALANIVKGTYALPTDASEPTDIWLANRLINDGLAMAVQPPAGPVHINIPLGEPLNSLRTRPLEIPEKEGMLSRKINVLTPQGKFNPQRLRQEAAPVALSPKVLVIAGFGNPSRSLTTGLKRLCRLPNVAIMTEAQSNAHLTQTEAICHIDATLSGMTQPERMDMLPDVVITLGGALVSRMVKEWLRSAPAGKLAHWHVGVTDGAAIDCFGHLTMRVEAQPEDFLPQLAGAMRGGCPSHYAREWRELGQRTASRKKEFINHAPWCDLTAMGQLLEALPAKANIQLSNGTVVRYAQLFPYDRLHRVDCNRGVSGIDGSTSTAIGASRVYKSGLTVLITGDLSAQYDLGALTQADIPSAFRMAVLDNGGGGIFRFIRTTRDLPELESYIATASRLPLRQLAEGLGFGYQEATDRDTLTAATSRFLDPDADKPQILHIKTPGPLSAQVLTEYFHAKS